ncbi:hypothetical protein [Shinella zoogloeoides]|uniref:hypothetical protein n=1 Tax=Shinella zoogloeoides TaxID=352475 RepID=UPI001F586A9B|nr:hypothetical protein [Shinella zoogloeoides]
MSVATTSASGTQPGFLLIGGGYIAAVLTATLVVIAILWFHAGTDEFLFQLFIMGCAYTFVCALPGFIATVVIARLLALRTWIFFTLAGGLDGMLSLVFFDRSLLRDTFVVFVVAGGLAGGLIYWLIAYRRRHPAA